jgi:hypothetical protein
MIYTNISDLKKQLYIEDSYTGDTAILTLILNAAEQAVINFCNAIVQISGYSGTTGTTSVLNLSGSTPSYIKITGCTGMTCTNVAIPIVQATYLLAANLYVNRTMVAFGQGFEIPFSFRFLLEPYKNFTIS